MATFNLILKRRNAHDNGVEEFEVEVDANTLLSFDSLKKLGSSSSTPGSITLSENTGVILDAALSVTAKHCGILEVGVAGAALPFGTLAYLAVADSRWEKTDADAEATAGPVKLGIVVVAAAADGDPVTLLLFGKVRADSLFPTLTVGAPVHVGVTAGEIQVAAPSANPDVVRVIGYGNTADELFFCPSAQYTIVPE
jgi:hypothetical protein